MKRISLYILISIFLFCFSFKAFGFQVDISKKYNNIFSSKILSEDDVYNYQQAYLFQEQCKWKNANRYILRIKNRWVLIDLLML